MAECDPRDTQLAIVARRLQWELDEAAYALPKGLYNTARYLELAVALEVVAEMLRAQAEHRLTAEPRHQRAAIEPAVH